MIRDDRLPMILVILDGLGDRQSPVLDGGTPCEKANTPVLDALVKQGQGGVLVPFGPGRATSSEVAHWSLFGFEDVPFPGRAALEGVGTGQSLPINTPIFHLALRQGILKDDRVFLGERARRGVDDDDATALFAALDSRDYEGVRFQQRPLRTGECLLIAHGATTRDVSDSDALFDHIHPWMRPLPLMEFESDQSRRFAGVLQQWLSEGRNLLLKHPVNENRKRQGRVELTVPVTKWASWIDPGQPEFETHNGLTGAAVTDTALYRGFAGMLGMETVDIPYDSENPQRDMEARMVAARELIRRNDFVHVHVKATDEAGHSKDPSYKKTIIEQTAAGLEPLLELCESTIVAVTGDHATPSVGSILHSGDPTPFLLAGPGVDRDDTQLFGERFCTQGAAGRLMARDVLPLMASFCNRPFFKGHRPGPYKTTALPNQPEAMPIRPQQENLE